MSSIWFSFVTRTHAYSLFLWWMPEWMIIRCIQKNSLKWRAERLSFARSFSLLQAMISKRRSFPIIRMGIRARPSSVVRWSVNKPINQLVNQSLLQSSFHKDPIPTKDFTEGPPDPIDGHSRSNSYNNKSKYKSPEFIKRKILNMSFNI
jgi:hypothetical protein